MQYRFCQAVENIPVYKTEIKVYTIGDENSCILIPDWTYVQSGVFLTKDFNACLFISLCDPVFFA